MGLDIFTMASSSGWVPGPAGGMATAGAGIGLSKRAAEVIAAAVVKLQIVDTTAQQRYAQAEGVLTLAAVRTATLRLLTPAVRGPALLIQALRMERPTLQRRMAAVDTAPAAVANRMVAAAGIGSTHPL